ncbi:MAG: ATP phosphoribosyltransferase regulatory subunit [Magnetovibrionaceae bacterium]
MSASQIKPMPALLPPGISDLLPPEAALEARSMESLMALFEARDFGRVKAPLIEFEDSLFAGSGAALAENTFRLMDPISQQMLGLRSDMTMQVARIAGSRLKKAPRPLRLCYGGQVLRVRTSQARIARQFAQVGAEIIGSVSPLADAEAATAAWEGLAGLGVAELSIDLTLPTLVSTVCDEADLTPELLAEVREVLGRKDPTAMKDLGPEIGEDLANTLADLLEATGPADAALAALSRLSLSERALAQIETLKQVIDRLGETAPGLQITVDPVEYRGFEYHAGVAFALFAGKVQGELGRGGRYVTPDGETATGFTLFMDTIQRALSLPEPSNRLFLPLGTAVEEACRLRREGWVTVEGLEAVADNQTEAQRLECSHVLQGGTITTVA